MYYSPSRPLTQTSPARDRLVPEVLDGPAEEDGAEDRPARPGEDERHQRVVVDPEQPVREYAQVLQQDGEFAEEEAQVVDDDRGPEGFGRGELFVGREVVEVSAHAVFDCGWVRCVSWAFFLMDGWMDGWTGGLGRTLETLRGRQAYCHRTRCRDEGVIFAWTVDDEDPTVQSQQNRKSSYDGEADRHAQDGCRVGMA